jgi:hypothetical protein
MLNALRLRMGIVPLLLCLPAVAAAQALPPGDGRVADHPVVGSVYACRTTFRAGGARHDGPWFHGSTWNPTEKPHVEGHVLWPDARFTLSSDDTERRFQGRGQRSTVDGQRVTSSSSQ